VHGGRLLEETATDYSFFASSAELNFGCYQYLTPALYLTRALSNLLMCANVQYSRYLPPGPDKLGLKTPFPRRRPSTCTTWPPGLQLAKGPGRYFVLFNFDR